MFEDRIDAGKQLAQKLAAYKDKKVLMILAVPRGGLPLGAILAKALNAPLDVALSKKIGHPYNKEYAIGAVSLESVVLGNATGIPKSYIEEETKLIREKLKKRYADYYKNRAPQSLKDKIVIIVDDGIATGNTIKATAELVHAQKPLKTIVAVPVAPIAAIENLKRYSYIDEVVCLNTPSNFQAVGQFYRDFGQVSDEEAIGILNSFNK